ncbi:MAG: hypothetical protein QE487_13750 [Fluviicola sp.]|nr:hypothetical protein [Fluviicola sp.]
MKIAFKKSVILFLSLCIAIESIACGGGGYYMEYDMLFDRNILFDNGKKTTSYNAWVYNSELYTQDSPRIQNTESWATYLENVYRKEDLERIIYRSPDGFDKTKEQKRLHAKRMKDADISKKEALFLDFISYALKVEKVIADNTPNPWADEVKEINQDDFNERIKEGKALLKAAKDDFMKERYAFQLIKLYRYSNQLDDAEKTYKTYFSNSTSLLGYWAMDHYAGILMKQNKPFEANHYFIKVYTNCSSKRESSYLSMQLDTEEDFKKTLALCTETEEKMALRYVRSMQTKALGLEDMQAITSALGNHEYARIIMTHEINKLERGSQTEAEPTEEDIKLLTEQVHNYTKDLIAFNESMLAKDDEDQFWHLSLAYLHYLNGQHTQCSTLLEKIKPKSPDFQKQHTIIYVVNYLATRQILTEVDENILGEKLFELNDNNVSYPYLYDEKDEEGYYLTDEYNTVNQFIFRQIYERSKTKNAFLELVFSGRTISDMRSEYPYVDETSEKQSEVAYIDKVLNDLQKTPETTLALYAANSFFYNYEDYGYGRSLPVDFEGCEQQLKEFKATLLMRDPARLDEAVAIFSELPKNLADETIFGNPFEFNLKNPSFDHFYDNRYSLKSMSKYDLAKKLYYLYKNKSTALDYYKLGLAYYNTSYYGLQWKAMAYYRSSYAPNGNYSMKAAELFFKKALITGKLTEEQKAQVYFMLARCEQNEYTEKKGEITAYFNSDNQYTFDIYMSDMRSEGALSNFEILQKNYSNTSFYDELIEECSYFSYYAN